MGLPDPDSGRTWGGKLLVDRDGAEIGTCTQILLDDATGKPEWATADITGGTAFIPLLDAVESGTQVRVVVRRGEVAEAPSVGDVHHLTEEEEERLYRHYGIPTSRAASESLLPADEVPAASNRAAASSHTPAPAPPVAGGLAEVTALGRSETDVADAGEAAAGPSRARRVLVLAIGGVVALGAIVGALLRSRRRPQPPPTRTERLAARARSAPQVFDVRRRQAVASAAPVLQTGRRLSVIAAQQAAIRAAAAAQRASTLAALAKAARLPGASSQAEDITNQIFTAAAARSQRRAKAAGALKSVVSFGAGYLLGSRAGRARFEQVKQATATWAHQPGVQQTRDRFRAGVTDTMQAGNARLSHSAAGVAGKLRRRSGGTIDPETGAGDPGNAAPDNGWRANSPDQP